MKRALVVAAVLAIAPSVASAQQEGVHGNAFVRVDPIGAPIAVVPMPELELGWYELQSFNLQPLFPGDPDSLDPDTAIAIRHRDHVAGTTFWHSDVCNTPGTTTEFERSCVRFEVRDDRFSRFWVWMRAFETMAAGTASLRVQRVDDATSIPVDVECTGDSLDGCWNTFATDVTFGGMTIPGDQVGGEIEDLMQLETTELPGTDLMPFPSWHAIMFSLHTGSQRRHDGYLRRNQRRGNGMLRGGPGTHPRQVGNTAIWTSYGVRRGFRDHNPTRGVIVAGPLFALGAGPFRLIRNDRVVHHDADGVEFTKGVDLDGDGLGEDLETILKTCDSVYSPSPAGFDCNPQQCWVDSTSELCRATLRDSDSDGMRDDHELYGVALYDGMVRRGTELARFGADPARFDAMVEIDYEGTEDQPVDPCDAADPVWFSAEELRDMASIFRNIPGFENRDGSTGIFVHMDAHLDPASRADWGVYGDWEGSWCEPKSDDPWQDSVASHRRWLFRHVKRFAGGGGNTGSGFSLHSASGQPGALVHEIGHQVGLLHEGPVGAVGINGNPLYRSRINYMYQEWGSFGDATHDPELDEVSFSDGLLSGTVLDPLDLDEVCPFGEDVDIGVLWEVLPAGNTKAHEVRDDISEGCVSVDWNRDGEYSTSVQARIARNAEHSLRQTPQNRIATLRTAGDLAVVGERMFHARLAPNGTEGLAQLVVNGGITCDECSAQYENAGAACWNADGEDQIIVLEDDIGVPLAMRSISLAAARPTSGGDLLVYVAHRPSGLVWGTVDPVTLAQFYGGPLPEFETTSLASGEDLVSLAAVGGAEHELILAHASPGGPVATYRGHVATSMEIVWDSPEPMESSFGNPIAALPRSSVGVATLRAPFGDGVAMAVMTVTGLHVMHRPLAATRWTQLANVGYTTWSRPSLAQTSYATGDRLVLAWTDGTLVARYSESDLDDPTTWNMGVGSPWSKELYGGWVASQPPLLAWDDRASASPKGLRAVHGQWHQCSMDSQCPSAASTCDGGFCVATVGSDLIVGTREYLLPFADGIAPIRLTDYDDRPMMRHGFCRSLRECDIYFSYGDHGGCVPTEYQELDPATGEPFGPALCAAQPTYDHPCEIDD